jgi:hypothetical protein
VEITRRWKALQETAAKQEPVGNTPKITKTKKNSPTPSRSQAWKVERLLLELDNSPIMNELDVEFLKKAVVLQRNAVEVAMDASHQEKLALDKSWTRKYPYLRLIHCLIDFQATIRMYLYRDSADPTRYLCENRNNPEKSRETVWEVLLNQWNDSDFEPSTRGLEHIHSDFQEECLFFEQVKYMTKADPEKIHSKFAAMVVEMGRCIAKWERSGQGDGGVELRPSRMLTIESECRVGSYMDPWTIAVSLHWVIYPISSEQATPTSCTCGMCYTHISCWDPLCSD